MTGCPLDAECPACSAAVGAEGAAAGFGGAVGTMGVSGGAAAAEAASRKGAAGSGAPIEEVAALAGHVTGGAVAAAASGRDVGATLTNASAGEGVATAAECHMPELRYPHSRIVAVRSAILTFASSYRTAALPATKFTVTLCTPRSLPSCCSTPCELNADTMPLTSITLVFMVSR